MFEHFRQNVDGENSQKWLICDGSVDYKWAENLESFMTSGVLTIHSGEELTISPHTKLIFETTHLRDVSSYHTISLLHIHTAFTQTNWNSVYFYLSLLRNVGRKKGHLYSTTRCKLGRVFIFYYPHNFSRGLFSNSQFGVICKGQT